MPPDVLIVTEDKNRFSALADALENLINADVSWAVSGSIALSKVERITPILAVIDETLPDMSGLEFARKLMKANALIYTAVASSLAPDDFHETSEGLGVLIQLSLSPGEKEARGVVTGLKNVFALPAA